MRYTNPLTKQFGFQKAWFFLDGDREHVMVSGVHSNSSAPVFSVLDQKKFKGPVLMDGKDISKRSEWKDGGSSYDSPFSLWHDDVGYVFPSYNATGQPSLVVKVGERYGNWSTIGTSAQPPYTVDLFASYLHHLPPANGSYPPTSYTTLPAISAYAFGSLLESSDPTGIQELRNDGAVSAIYDDTNDRVYAVFWDVKGGEVGFSCADGSRASVVSSANLAVILDIRRGVLTVSDPGQSLTVVGVKVNGRCLGSRKLTIQLPGGVEAGRSLERTL
jgi:hypothetical protein